MTRRFRFSPPSQQPHGSRDRTPAPSVVKHPQATERAREDFVLIDDPLRWSRRELSDLSKITSDDVADTRSWLTRLGMVEALEMFDAHPINPDK